LKKNEKDLVFLEHIAIIYRMDTIFAPWRIAYIRAEKREGCVLCRDSLRGDELVVHEGKSCFVTVNRYPYTGGHLMIVPYRHLSSLTDLLQEERLEVFALMDLSVQVLTEAMKPQGFNIGMNDRIRPFNSEIGFQLLECIGMDDEIIFSACLKTK